MFSDRLIEFCKKNDNIYLYGTGVFARQAAICLIENDITFHGFTVTSKEDDTFLGKNVYQIDEIQQTDVSFVICINEHHHNEVLDTIKKFYPDVEFLLMFERDKDELESLNESNMTESPITSINAVNIILFHRINVLKNDKWDLAVTPYHFEQIISYLKENYQILRFTDDISHIDRPSVVITFDDGYEDNYLNAFPILKKYNVPATIFVTTENIDSDKEQWWDRLTHMFFYNSNLPKYIDYLGKRYWLENEYDKTKALRTVHKNLLAQPNKNREYSLLKIEELLRIEGDNICLGKSLTSDEIRDMDRSGLITIGGHTVTHTNLAAETVSKQYYEIVDCKKTLENIVEHEINVFSYPFGKDEHLSVTIEDTLKKCGFKRCAVNYKGLVKENDNLFYLKRNAVWGVDLKKFIKWFNNSWLV